MALNDLRCKTAKPKDKPYKLSDSGGLYLQVMPNGSKYWRLKYRHLGKEKLLALGIYPAKTLAEAREARDNAKKLLEQDIDPSIAKTQKRLDAITSESSKFGNIAQEWLDQNKNKWTEKYAADSLARLKNNIFPYLENRSVDQITPMEVLSVIKKIEDRDKLEMAKKTLNLCKRVFTYAVITGRAANNPAADLSGALKSKKVNHFAALQIKELPKFLKKLERNETRAQKYTLNATRLLMLTFVRTQELIGAKWDEIDSKAAVWYIPAERMKMRKPHIVPLSTQALAILEDQKKITGDRKFVFASHQSTTATISNNTILHNIKRMGYEHRMTGHGFRALAMSTLKEQLGYRHEVVDRQLAHAPRNSVDRAYDRAEFLGERKEMMQDWADYLDAIEQTGELPEEWPRRKKSQNSLSKIEIEQLRLEFINSQIKTMESLGFSKEEIRRMIGDSYLSHTSAIT